MCTKKIALIALVVLLFSSLGYAQSFNFIEDFTTDTYIEYYPDAQSWRSDGLLDTGTGEITNNLNQIQDTFELPGGIGAWTAGSGTTLTLVASPVHSGTRSMQITRNASGLPNGFRSLSDFDKTKRVSYWVYIPSSFGGGGDPFNERFMVGYGSSPWYDTLRVEFTVARQINIRSQGGGFGQLKVPGTLTNFLYSPDTWYEVVLEANPIPVSSGQDLNVYLRDTGGTVVAVEPPGINVQPNVWDGLQQAGFYINGDVATMAGDFVYVDDYGYGSTPGSYNNITGSQIQSKTVGSKTSKIFRVNADYTWIDEVNAAHQMYISNNGGSTWYAVSDNVPFNIPTNGGDLKYKFEFTSSSTANTDHITNLDLDYDIYLEADFDIEQNLPTSTITLLDRTQYQDSNLVAWEWEINSVVESTDQNYSFFASLGETVNACLTATVETELDGNVSDQFCQSFDAFDIIFPTVDANINFISGFTSNHNVNYNITCYDNSTPLDYRVRWVDNNGTIINILDDSDANATLKSGSYDIGQNSGHFNFSCADSAGNITQRDSINVYGLHFNLINERTGDPFTTLQINALQSALVSTLDGNYTYDFQSGGGTTQTDFMSTDDTLLFKFLYSDPLDTLIQREIDFSLASGTDVNICIAEFEQFFLNRFVSTKNNKEVRLYNDKANCYNLLGTTHYIFELLYGIEAYTIADSYTLTTTSDDGITTSAGVAGAESLQHNLDAIQFSQQIFDVSIGQDAVSFYPLLNPATQEFDQNTLQIFFKSFNTGNRSTQLQIFLNGTQLFTYTEFNNPDEFAINWVYADINGLSDQNTLKLITTKTDGDGLITTFDTYFNITGEIYANLGSQPIAFIISILLILFGITLIKSNEAFGWFGIVCCIIALGITAFVISVWWIALLQAAIVVIILYIIFTTRGNTGGIV